jgi:membrane peptidoglycan carboxypeptidase
VIHWAPGTQEEVAVATSVVRGQTRQARRRGGFLRGVLRVVVALVLLTAVLLGLGWVATPSVDDAARRVAAHLADHDAPVLSGPVPAKVAAALISTEDSRFYDTPGVDPLGLVREPLGGLIGHDTGGATLEQQLAKNLYTPGRDSVVAKAEDVVVALKLDRHWTKQEILRMYLDEGYYGHGLYGLTAAAQGYFGVAPADLSWAQASLVAGLLQAPSAYDPLQHPDAARARQAHVLGRLVATGRLTRSAADRIAADPWALRRG